MLPLVAAKRGLNRKNRASLWGFTQDTRKAAFECRGGRVLKLPAMDSSQTCAKCGHVDAKSRDGRCFRCTACGHTANADVNAGQILRARARRWFALKAVSGCVKPRINGEQRVAEATTCRVERQGVASRQAALRLLRCAPALRVTRRNPLTQLAFMAGSRLPAVNDPLCENTAIQKVNPHILCSPLFGAFGSPSTKAQGFTDGEVNNALWKELKARRKTCPGHAGARTKPARKATGAQHYNGGAGATVDSAWPEGPPTRGGGNAPAPPDPSAGTNNGQYETYTQRRPINGIDAVGCEGGAV